MFAFHYASLAINRDELGRTLNHMAARGPDDSGEWYSADGRVALGHRRLSIIDLSDKGRQPMLNADGTLVISFNGEIYNYQELRRSLQESGCIFESKTDTEVLLHLYAKKGEAMVKDLRGMFAFALWDANKNALMLARDPYGIKPLYYADDGWTVRAASQVKALLAGGNISRVPEPAGIIGFFLFGSVPEPYTIYQEIRAVPAGSIVWIDALGASEPKKYFSIATVFQEAFEESQQLTEDQIQHTVRDALFDSVRHHLIADVPVGAFLSAGIDSGTLVGLARDAGAEDLQTVNLTFQGLDYDEAALGEVVAKQYGTKHTVRLLGTTEFRSELPGILAAMDQPSIDGINVYFISKVAAETGLKVALSGLGGDELFGGYSTFRNIRRWVKSVTIPGHIPGLGRLLRSVTSPLLPDRVSPKLAGMVEYGGTYSGAYLLQRGLFMPWELKKILNADLVNEGLRRLAPLDHISDTIRPDPQTPFARVATLEASLYMRNQLLRDADWAGMCHSLEIRVPLVDVKLLKSVAPALVTQSAQFNGKHLLAQAPAIPLPQAVLQRAKTGFTVPIGKWLEEVPDMDVWRKIPGLVRGGCHGSRRWAYALYTSCFQ